MGKLFVCYILNGGRDVLIKNKIVLNVLLCHKLQNSYMV
jgi:hypothetical protein